MTPPPSRHRPADAPPPADLAALAARVRALLRPHAKAERRAFLSSGYATSSLKWLGVPVPAVRRVVLQLSRALAASPPETIIDFALMLVARGAIEERQVGYESIGRRSDALALVTRRLAERLGAGNDNWAAVDAFATSVTGPAWRIGALADRDLLTWAHSADPWWRRTALVSTVSLNTVSRGGRGDSRRTLRICRAIMTGELTPMLGKALSWALRALAAHDPAGVRAFLDRYRARLPAAVVREVTTKLATGRKRG